MYMAHLPKLVIRYGVHLSNGFQALVEEINGEKDEEEQRFIIIIGRNFDILTKKYTTLL